MSDVPRVYHRTNVDTVGSHLRRGLEMVGFWMAVALPFVVGSAIAAGLWRQYPLTLTALLGLNLAALVLGQNYHQ